MALSERERQVLRDLEEQLHDEDPALAGSMEQAERDLGRLSPRHVGAGTALVLLGLAVVIGGVAVGHGILSILLGVAGFALAVWGVTLMLTKVEASPQTRADAGGRSDEGGRGRFMDRQTERWERRRDQRL